MDLVSAITDGLVRIDLKGAGPGVTSQCELTVGSLTNAPLNLDVLRGTQFLPSVPGLQTMVSTGGVQIQIDGGATETVTVPTICGSPFVFYPPPTEGGIQYTVLPDVWPGLPIIDVVNGLGDALKADAGSIGMPLPMFIDTVGQYTTWSILDPSVFNQQTINDILTQQLQGGGVSPEALNQISVTLWNSVDTTVKTVADQTPDSIGGIIDGLIGLVGEPLPMTVERPGTSEKVRDCADIALRAADLLTQLEALSSKNGSDARAACEAFLGSTDSKFADGYAHWFTQAKVTEAVVDSNNAVGKTIIDVALFAAGGWSGVAKGAEGAGLLSKSADVSGKLAKWLGKGMGGAKSAKEAWTKVGQKVAEKAEDSLFGHKAGKAAGTAQKAIEKGWKEASGGAIESLVKGAVLDALGDWMKEGAMSGDLERAKQSYADFVAASTAANADAAGALALEAEYRDLMAQAEALGCPIPDLPNLTFYTFDIEQFGEGAFRGEDGPTMVEHGLVKDKATRIDLFWAVGHPDSLPF